MAIGRGESKRGREEAQGWSKVRLCSLAWGREVGPRLP